MEPGEIRNSESEMSSVNTTENSDHRKTKLNPEENCQNIKDLRDNYVRNATEPMTLKTPDFKERGDVATNICSISMAKHEEIDAPQDENTNKHNKYLNKNILNAEYEKVVVPTDLKICGISIAQHEQPYATRDVSANIDSVPQSKNICITSSVLKVVALKKNEICGISIADNETVDALQDEEMISTNKNTPDQNDIHNISEALEEKVNVLKDLENWCISSLKDEKVDVLQDKKTDTDIQHQNKNICDISNAESENVVLLKDLEINIDIPKQNKSILCIYSHMDAKVNEPHDDKTHNENSNKNNSTCGIFGAEDGNEGVIQDDTYKINSDQNNMPQKNDDNAIDGTPSTSSTADNNATDSSPGTSKTTGRKRGPGNARKIPPKKAKTRGVPDFYKGKLSNVVYFVKSEDDFDYLSDDSLDLL